VPFLLAERARSECARSMRAVKGGLGYSLNRGLRNWKALARAYGTSRRASRWAGEKAGFLEHSAATLRSSEVDRYVSLVSLT
jgi:hypothetical protein